MTNSETVLWRVLSDDAHAAFALVDYSLRIHSLSRRAASLLDLPSSPPEGMTLPDAAPGQTALPRSEPLRRAVLDQAPTYAEETHDGVRYRVSYRPFPPVSPGATANVCVVLWTPIAALPPELLDAPTSGPNPRRRSRYAGLNETDVAVLRLIADGMTTAQIAERLSRSVKTIEWRRMAIGRKLNATNRVDLALLALRLGIISLEPMREPSQPPADAPTTRPPSSTPGPSGSSSTPGAPSSPASQNSHGSARRATPTLRPLASAGPSSRRAS